MIIYSIVDNNEYYMCIKFRWPHWDHPQNKVGLWGSHTDARYTNIALQCYDAIFLYCQFVAGRYGNIRPQVADDMEIFGRKLRANIFIFGRKLEITVNL